MQLDFVNEFLNICIGYLHQNVFLYKDKRQRWCLIFEILGRQLLLWWQHLSLKWSIHRQHCNIPTKTKFRTLGTHKTCLLKIKSILNGVWKPCYCKSYCPLDSWCRLDPLVEMRETLQYLLHLTKCNKILEQPKIEYWLRKSKSFVDCKVEAMRLGFYKSRFIFCNCHIWIKSTLF